MENGKLKVENEEPEPEVPTFTGFHDGLRRRCRMGRFRASGKTPFIREPREGEIKGKAAIKAARRERVKAMKAAQGT